MTDSVAAEDMARFVISALEAECCGDQGVKLKKVTRDRDMLAQIIQILPELKFKGFVVFDGPPTKNTVIRLGYA